MTGAPSVTRELFDLPDAMAGLPRDHRGYPIPRFVHIRDDGTPDFRVIAEGWWAHCHNKKRCWLCGGGMGNRKWFVTGPMCTITRTISEPPSHRQCALFAIKNCPFLTRPLAQRNERDLPQDATMAGLGIQRNPGVVALWETLSYTIFRDPAGLPLIQMGPPVHVSFWREGRRATTAEVQHSIATGIPALAEAAAAEGATGALEATIVEYNETIFKRWA
jgi:hypothetical protein